jgi:hypothetical protein
MHSTLGDTWGRLPSVTRPVPSIPLRTLRSSSERSSRIRADLTDSKLAALARDEGRRWSAWGAARDGARTVVSRRQQFVGAACLGIALAFSVLLPHSIVLMSVAFVTCTYLLAGTYKAILLVRGERGGRWISADDPFVVPDE